MTEINRDIPYGELIRIAAVRPYHDACVSREERDGDGYSKAYSEVHGIVRVIAASLLVSESGVMKDIQSAHFAVFGGDD